MVKNSSKPQKKIVLLASLFLGLLLPIFVLYIKQMLSTKVETPKDIDSLSKSPLIGQIPLSNQDEAIRNLRTNLLLGFKDGQKVVLMVSESEGDGKTCLAKRLVDSLTTIGKKALYFNADLRSQGMAKGQHPVDFLASTDFAHQMADAKANNDYVIVDTPALCKYNDAYQIAQFADVTCYVIKPGSTSKSAIEKLEKDSRLPNVKFIINAIDMSKKKFKYLYKNLAFVLISLFVFSSCMSTKNITYFQNKDDINLVASKQLYDAKIMPKDILQIQVFSMTPGASESFNLLKNISASTSTTTTTNQNSVYNYLVSNDGTIVMPIIGTVKVGGLSKNEAESLIKSKILPYMSESENVVVHVRMMNYKYAVLGGVRKPGLYTTQNEKVSILEAIAQAGDLTTFAYRDRIFLIREYSDGQKEYHQLNINDANIISSPYYYLQQNDVIYVESRKTEARNAFISSNTSIWITLASSLMSIATFIIALSK
jgi:polysaccharide export outer membrane protein